VIAPEVPAGRPVGQTIFDHQTHRPLDDTMGGVTTGRGPLSEIEVAVLPARRAVVRRVGHQQVDWTWTAGRDIAKIVYGALPGCVARGPMATAWAGGVVMVPAVRHQLRPWEVLDVANALRRVWHIFTRSEQRVLPCARASGDR
jgi:hypothetical protein